MLNEPDTHSNSLLCAQLLLLLVFVGSYVAAVSAFHGPRGRLRAAALALLAAIGVCAVFEPWTMGVMLVAGCIVGVGSFIAATVAISRLLGLGGAVDRREYGPAARVAQPVESVLPRQAEPVNAR